MCKTEFVGSSVQHRDLCSVLRDNPDGWDDEVGVGERLTKEGTYVCACVLSHFSHVQLFVTLWTAACQVPLSMGILQARILEWVTMPSCRKSSRAKAQTHVSYSSCTGRQILYH